MQKIRGTEGYAEIVEAFTEATKSITFAQLHQPFIEFLPVTHVRMLDVGSGIGRDASILAEMGHDVVAVEPIEEFRMAAKRLYGASSIKWVNDSLPHLRVLGGQPNQFNFILSSGVWHHLDDAEQRLAMLRIANLLCTGGVFALSLRHGLAGAGTCIFPTCGQRTIEDARDSGLRLLLHLPHQPSLMRKKEHVTWTRLAFAK